MTVAAPIADRIHGRHVAKGAIPCRGRYEVAHEIGGSRMNNPTRRRPTPGIGFDSEGTNFTELNAQVAELAVRARATRLERKQFADLQINLGPNERGNGATVGCDATIMTDLRFPGGSSVSTLEEILIQHELGLETGLYHRPSTTIAQRRAFHEGILNTILTGKSKLLNFEKNIVTKLLIVRHPGVIHPPISSLPNITTEHVVLVINHPPINANRRIDYILPFVTKTLREKYEREPLVFAIGPLVRDAINDCYEGAVLQRDYWSNVFNLDRFHPIANRRFPIDRKLRIGRHSRPGLEKWPDTAEDIRAAYLLDTDYEVIILGGGEVPSKILGFTPKNWTVLPFGSRDIVEFLSEIDIFVYYHHPNWVEAFGRVVAEALASGLPAILPPHFQPLFREAAIYASPQEVLGVVQSSLTAASL